MFGFYYPDSVENIRGVYCQVSSTSFMFNLRSNGRLPTPMKFETLDPKENRFGLFDKNEKYLARLGDLFIYKKENKDESFCWQCNKIFNYHNYEKALCGIWCPYHFIFKRIFIIEMI